MANRGNNGEGTKKIKTTKKKIMAFNMKNPLLNGSAKSRKPMQGNYKSSAAKQDVTVGELMANVGKSPEPDLEKPQSQIDFEAQHRAEYMAKKAAREKDAFSKEKDLVKKYRKPEIIASEDGDTFRTSGKPKKYQVLQADGSYKTVTNPSGSSSLSADDIQNYTTLFESRSFEDSPAFD